MFTPVLYILCTPDEVTSIQGHHVRRQEGSPRAPGQEDKNQAEIQPHLLVNQVLFWDCICPKWAGFFFCTFPKVSIGLTVASLTVSLVQSQPLLPDLILQNLDLLKENK